MNIASRQSCDSLLDVVVNSLKDENSTVMNPWSTFLRVSHLTGSPNQ